jgi:3-hydroxymyristoyl/3-hydroxydecanoyl-(acyl carrier protein) dehydratase
MPEKVLSALELGAYLPHRGVNLIPDTVTLAADGVNAVSRTRIGPGDPRGREIFARFDGGAQNWYEPFLCELLALTGVPLLHERLKPANQVAVFSMMSRITFHRLAPLDREVLGYATITRDRGNFTVFATKAEVDGQLILDGEVMSGVATLAEIAAKRTPAAATAAGEPVDASWFSWKPARTRFIDRLVSIDVAAKRLVAGYTYPADHPFVTGHFPELPVMMGVTQLAAFADAAMVAARTFGIPGAIVANGTIKRHDGVEILDVRDMHLSDPGPGHAPRFVGVKRLAFRDPVLPNDVITIDVTVKPV